jgi:hypothetical protein
MPKKVLAELPGMAYTLPMKTAFQRYQTPPQMKKTVFLSLVFFCCTHCLFAFNAAEAIERLREKVMCRGILDYLVESEYQKGREFIYEAYVGDERFYDSYMAFELVSQSTMFVYKTIRFVELYRYYGMTVEIHKLPAGSKTYYVAIIDATGQQLGYDFLLFDMDEHFLDKYRYGSRHVRRDRKTHEYAAIRENDYGILVYISGSFGLYIDLLIIDDDKFKRILTFIENFLESDSLDRADVTKHE